MTGRWSYDDALDPPAPVVPIRLADPMDGAALLVSALVDTGADCTLIPPALVRRLRLPLVAHLTIAGVGGSPRRATVHAALLEVAGLRTLARVVAFGEEAIMGRDVLNRLFSTLDGPGLVCALRTGRRVRRGRGGARRRGPARRSMGITPPPARKR